MCEGCSSRRIPDLASQRVCAECFGTAMEAFKEACENHGIKSHPISVSPTRNPRSSGPGNPGPLSPSDSWEMVDVADAEHRKRAASGTYTRVRRRAPPRELMSGLLNFYISPARTAGFARFASSWHRRPPSECANNIFGASAALFDAAPFEVAAFAYDGVVALLAAFAAARSTAAADVMAALTSANMSFEGATGTVRRAPRRVA